MKKSWLRVGTAWSEKSGDTLLGGSRSLGSPPIELRLGCLTPTWGHSQSASVGPASGSYRIPAVSMRATSPQTSLAPFVVCGGLHPDPHESRASCLISTLKCNTERHPS